MIFSLSCVRLSLPTGQSKHSSTPTRSREAASALLDSLPLSQWESHLPLSVWPQHPGCYIHSTQSPRHLSFSCFERCNVVRPPKLKAYAGPPANTFFFSSLTVSNFYFCCSKQITRNKPKAEIFQTMSESSCSRPMSRSGSFSTSSDFAPPSRVNLEKICSKAPQVFPFTLVSVFPFCFDNSS